MTMVTIAEALFGGVFFAIFKIFLSDNQRFLLSGLHPGWLPADVHRKDFCFSLVIVTSM